MTKFAKHLWAYLLFFLATVIIFDAIAWSVAAINHANEQKRYEKRLKDAISYCDSLFNEETIAYEDTTHEDLLDCKTRLEDLNSQEERATNLAAYTENALSYLSWTETADQFLDDSGIVLSSLEEDDLTAITNSSKSLAEAYQPLVIEKLRLLTDEFNAMQAAREAIDSLFTSADHETARTDISRQSYENAKEKVENLKQADLKESYQKPLEDALKAVEELERIARERAEAARKAEEERQRKIAESWTRLDLSPYYINQHSAGIDNGCEAASLLMALKYKGYLRGADFRSFALGMPTSDDPNTGFYLSITDLEPRDEAHWIAPAPLAAYGISASGASIINATGWSLDRLDEEVRNGNPVVIYLTYHFNNPKPYARGVPKNLHVLVLSGFNSYTGEQVFYDPWPAGAPSTTLSKARTEYLYAASGARALVVR